MSNLNKSDLVEIQKQLDLIFNIDNHVVSSMRRTFILNSIVKDFTPCLDNSLVCNVYDTLKSHHCKLTRNLIHRINKNKK